MIKRFNTIEGKNIEPIYGQNRFGYSKSDFEDLQDLRHWVKRGGYPGMELLFYDFHTGKVYQPFPKKRNVIYGRPVYIESYLYFLQADNRTQKITLYQYLPEIQLKKITELPMEDVNLNNLIVVGNPVSIISQDFEEGFHCYYPEVFSFPLEEHESVILIEDGRVYIEAWVEEGWDEARDVATNQYRYYNRILIKDFKGHLLMEEIGCLNQDLNGDWWIA